jgi:dTMP kinase
MALLFTADRQHHYDHVIKPELQRGNSMICDRYLWSTMVYQRANVAQGSKRSALVLPGK